MTDALASSGLLVVDKPLGVTSHDVVSKMRKAMSTRRIGHAGTLDPLASGVLVLGVERGTRFLAHMTAATKSYAATIRLGKATTTDDAEGEVVGSPMPGTAVALERSLIDASVAELTGDISQRPSSFSAVRVNGRHAYDLARSGQNIELDERPVAVSRFEVLGDEQHEGFRDLTVEVDCSSGTFIRALARDLGRSLGVGGHLVSLRRTALGPFTLRDAEPMAEIQQNPRLQLSIDEALTRCYPTLNITTEEGAKLATGKWLEPRGVDGVHAAVTPEGQAIALVKEKGSRLASVFVARPVTLS